MKKITTQYGSFFEVLIIISALLIAMYAEGQNILILKWFPLSLLWGISLWSLRNPYIYNSILKDKVFISLSAFIAWAVISSLFLSSAKSISILMLMPFIGGLLSYLIGYTGSDKKDRYVDWLLMGVGLMLAFITCYQKFALGDSRPTGLLSNWNSHAAVLTIIILPWVLRYALKPTVAPFQLIYTSILSFFFAFAISLTLSRGVLLISGAGFICLFWIAWRKQLFYKHSLILLTAFIAGYLIMGLFSTETIISRIQDTSQAESLVSLGSGRHLLWLPAWQMYLDRPFTGWGLGTFRFLYLQYKPVLSGESGEYAHNDYLQFLLELGPIGLILFLGFVFLLIKRFLNFMTSQWPKPSAHKIEALALLTSCIGLLMHTFFTFHLYHFTLQIIFGYYLGRSSRYLQNDHNVVHKKFTPEDDHKYRLFYRGFASLVVLLIICFGLSLNFLNNAELETNKEKKMDYLWKAGLFFPSLEHYDSYSSFMLSKHLQKLELNHESSQQRDQMAALALAEVNTAIDKMPYNVRNYITKASILKTLHKDIASVSEQYEHALRNTPANLGVRYQYTHHLIEQKQDKKALSVLWAAWNRITVERYQTGIRYLTYQLEINQHYGNKNDNRLIENEIQRLKKINKTQEGGVYVFKK